MENEIWNILTDAQKMWIRYNYTRRKYDNVDNEVIRELAYEEIFGFGNLVPIHIG